MKRVQGAPLDQSKKVFNNGKNNQRRQKRQKKGSKG